MDEYTLDQIQNIYDKLAVLLGKNGSLKKMDSVCTILFIRFNEINSSFKNIHIYYNITQDRFTVVDFREDIRGDTYHLSKFIHQHFNPEGAHILERMVLERT